MGARAGWRWISVVVMGRLPVRLSLRATRGLQDKRRRVRITPVYSVYMLVGFSLSIWPDRRSRLSVENLCDQQARALFCFPLFELCRRANPRRDARCKTFFAEAAERFSRIFSLSVYNGNTSRASVSNVLSTTSCNPGEMLILMRVTPNHCR